MEQHTDVRYEQERMALRKSFRERYFFQFHAFLKVPGANRPDCCSKRHKKIRVQDRTLAAQGGS